MLEPANYSAMETARNGRKFEIRAQRPQDRDALTAAAGRLSDESLYHRFFIAKHHFTEEEAAYFLDIDFVNHVALVAVVDENGKPAIIAGARYIVVEPGRAEMAFGVVDEYQGQGVGAALMRHLAAIAREKGLRELFAEVLADNAAMLKVFEKSGLEMSARRDGPTIHVTLRLA